MSATTVRPSNRPYDPVYFPEIGEPWRGLLVKFLRYWERTTMMWIRGSTFFLAMFAVAYLGLPRFSAIRPDFLNIVIGDEVTVGRFLVIVVANLYCCWIGYRLGLGDADSREDAAARPSE